MPTFFTLNPNTGWITVASRLTDENQDYYIGRVVAYDGGNPPHSATATVKINILRNLNQPIFTPQSYQRTIDETFPAGASVLSVTCFDRDRTVSMLKGIL